MLNSGQQLVNECTSNVEKWMFFGAFKQAVRPKQTVRSPVIFCRLSLAASAITGENG